jgi:hypothetical protein
LWTGLEKVPATDLSQISEALAGQIGGFKVT